MVEVKNIVMEFDLNRGKVRSIKERLFAKVADEVKKEKKFRALDNVSFKIEKGEIFGIIGSNGAGKSTMLKVLAGIMCPTSGNVITKGSIAPMIELGTGFDYELSAYENIFLSGSILGYNEKFLSEKVDSIFDFAELWDFKDVPVKYFSSGMIARLAFAISTIVTPDILIIDEILSVGDMAFQNKSKNRMLELMQSGTTVIYVSHDIESVKALCDRAMWLEHGKVKVIDQAEIVCQKYIDFIRG